MIEADVAKACRHGGSDFSELFLCATNGRKWDIYKRVSDAQSELRYVPRR